MADYISSNVEAAVSKFVGGLLKAMNRTPFHEFAKVLFQNNGYIMPDANSLRDSDKRPVKAKIMKSVVDEATSGRTCVIGGNFGDSITSTLNWYEATANGKVSLKQSQDNVFMFQEQVQQRLTDMRKSILTKLESDIQTWMEANRSTVNPATSYGSFDGVTNVFEIDPAYGSNPGFLNIVEQMLKENRYVDPMYQAIVNGFTWPQLRYQSNQGAGNNANQMFQFDNFMVSNGLGYLDANYPNWFGYFFAEGTVGALNWSPLDYRQPSADQSARDNIGIKSIIPDPVIPGLNYTLKVKVECEDTTDNNGGTDDEVMKMQMSTDYSLNYAIPEDGSTPIFAAGSEGAA